MASTASQFAGRTILKSSSIASSGASPAARVCHAPGASSTPCGKTPATGAPVFRAPTAVRSMPPSRRCAASSGRSKPAVLPSSGDRWQLKAVPPVLDRPSVLEGLPRAAVKAMLDLMVLAFWTDTTRIITFMLAGRQQPASVWTFWASTKNTTTSPTSFATPGSKPFAGSMPSRAGMWLSSPT